MNGVLIVNKEKGKTSRDVVNDLVHFFHFKKIGHTGTLDPLAEGVLVVTLGKYTKLTNALTSLYKEYIGTMQLGLETDTLDIEGNIIREEKEIPSVEEITRVFDNFPRNYKQEVPLYSAVKINGLHLYQYARRNEEVTLPTRDVEIKHLEILEIKDNIVTFKALVSKGTYIRSLIRDIGKSLGVGATMLALTRTKQGSFLLEDAKTIEQIKKGDYQLLKIRDVLDVEVINDYIDLPKIKNGVRIEYNTDKEFLLFLENGAEVALYKKTDDMFCMFIKLL